MLTLHIFGPAYGLPEGSPFGIKAIMLLKLAGLPFETKRSDLRKAPRRKLPVLDDDGEIIPDSTFIRMHLERKYKIDFDAALSPRERSATTVSNVSSRVVPPAPYVTLTNVGRSGIRRSTASSRPARSSGVRGGKNSNDAVTAARARW